MQSKPPVGWALLEGQDPAAPRYQTVPKAAGLVTWHGVGGRLRRVTRGAFVLADGTPVDVRVLARRPVAPPELLSVTEIDGDQD